MGEEEEGKPEEVRSAWYHLGRSYLDLQHLRMAVEARLRKLYESVPKEEIPAEIVEVLEGYRSMLRREEKELLERITPLLRREPLWEWCSRVRGMGPVACLTFLSFINPYRATTAGKAKAYVGAVPGSRLRAGQKTIGNPEAKGRGPG